jgi:hypothetical protein
MRWGFVSGGVLVAIEDSNDPNFLANNPVDPNDDLWVQLPGNIGPGNIGWAWDGQQFTPPEAPEEAKTVILGPEAGDVPGGMPGRVHVVVRHEDHLFALPLLPLPPGMEQELLKGRTK